VIFSYTLMTIESERNENKKMKLEKKKATAKLEKMDKQSKLLVEETSTQSMEVGYQATIFRSNETRADGFKYTKILVDNKEQLIKK
jgi:hypothetical protein